MLSTIFELINPPLWQKVDACITNFSEEIFLKCAHTRGILLTLGHKNSSDQQN